MTFTATTSGVRFAVHAQPRASKTEVVGLHADAIKIRIAAPPVEGAANDELVRFLARQLRVSASSVRVVSGETGKKKIIEVTGATVEQARDILLGKP